MYLLLELMEGGDLRTFIRESRPKQVCLFLLKKNQKGCVGIRKLKAYEKMSSFLVKQNPSNKMVSKLFDR